MQLQRDVMSCFPLCLGFNTHSKGALSPSSWHLRHSSCCRRITGGLSLSSSAGLVIPTAVPRLLLLLAAALLLLARHIALKALTDRRVCLHDLHCQGGGKHGVRRCNS